MPANLLKYSMIKSDSVEYTITYSDAFVDTDQMPSHIHNYIEIYLNVSGDVSFLVKNSIYPISSGDIIISNANDFHHCIHHSSGNHEHFCLWLSDSDSELLTFLKNNTHHHLVFSEDDKEKITELFRNLYTFSTREDKLSSAAYLLQILVMLNKKLVSSAPSLNRTLPEDFQNILDYINNNYSTITNICEITESFFISLSTLNRRFLKYLQISPKNYLEAVKMSNALRLLSEGKSVTAVCNECGYSDCSHFIRNFKKKFGVTPYKYKLNL